MGSNIDMAINCIARFIDILVLRLGSIYDIHPYSDMRLLYINLDFGCSCIVIWHK